MNTKTTIQELPKLYSQEEITDPECPLRLVSPLNGWAWYPIEAEPVGEDGKIISRDKGTAHDWLCFGFVDGDFPEWGYFHTSDLELAGVLRDLDWVVHRAFLVLCTTDQA